MNKSINAKFHTLQSVFGPDHGKVAKQLKVKELARAVTKGCQNQPHTCITHDSELPIYQYHEQLLESTNTGYLVELEEKQLALAKAAEAFDVDRINEVLHAATVSYTLIKDKIDEELGEAFLKERAAYNDLLAFRDEHGLRREPSFRPDMQAALLVLSTIKSNREYPFEELPRLVPYIRTYRAVTTGKVSSVTDRALPLVVA